MQSIVLGGGRLAAAAAAVLVVLSAAAAPAPDARVFTELPAIERVLPSPSGKRLALLVGTKEGRNALEVLDLPAKDPAHVVAAFGDANILGVHWVNDERLIYDAAQDGPVVRVDGAGTFAVNHDGSGKRQLIAWRDANPTIGTLIAMRMLTYDWSLLRTLADGSADVIVVQRNYNPAGDLTTSKPARLNTVTGAVQDLGIGVPSDARQWVFDGHGDPRVVRTASGGRSRMYLHLGDDWQLVSDEPLRSDRALQPLYLETAGALIVQTNIGHDTLGLYAYDPKQKQLDPEPLAQAERFDVDAVEFDDRAGQLEAARLVTDRPQTVWFTARMATIQKAVDAALPGRFNEIHCGFCESTPVYVVHSSTDRDPGEYLVYDHEHQRLTRIGAARPAIDPATQGRRSFSWVKMRDGLAIPVVVTHPPGGDDKTPRPAVVLVHGGPWWRGGDRRWSAEPQFLATRGWVVIEPEFRGSLGYGGRLFHAGWRQWGQAMEDDLADATRWAVTEGLVDPKRVCIYGGSYGGYAALMGMVRYPELFRCGASFAGVTDISLMFTSARSDISEDSRRFSLPELIGDPERDAAMLHANSPIDRVADIHGPILLVQGTLDRRVPREHANRFEAAARRAGVSIERVDYNDEAHGWFFPEDHADFLRRLEKFLSQSLAP